jgi:CBS domain-containing membrane protein
MDLPAPAPSGKLPPAHRPEARPRSGRRHAACNAALVMAERRGAVWRVGDVMRRDFVFADPDESLGAARQTMRMARLRHLLVARDGRLLGLLTYRELLEARLRDGRDEGRTGDALKSAVAWVTPDTPLRDAADRLSRYGFGCLPVLEPFDDDGREPGALVGLVTELDLLRAAYALAAP